MSDLNLEAGLLLTLLWIATGVLIAYELRRFK